MINFRDLELPQRWVECSLPDFTDIIMGQSPPSETYNLTGKGLPFFQGKAEFGDLYPTKKKYCSDPKKIASKGSVLMSVRAPVGPTNIAPEKCCIGRGLAAFASLGGVSNHFRQALLKHAFQGKLTEQWRKDNADKLETADQLLARIQQERVARYQQQLDEWEEAVRNWEFERKKGKKPAKPLLLKPFKAIESEKASLLPALPEGWVWTNFVNLIEYVTSGSRGWAKYYAESEAIFIRAQNLKYDRLDLDDIAFVELPDSVEGKRTLTKKGDLLITITGANVTKTAYVKNDIGEAYVSQHVALCRLVNSQTANYLLMFLIAGVAGRKQLEKAALKTQKNSAGQRTKRPKTRSKTC